MGDTQLESTLLCSCLALPNVSFVFRACPPSHLYHFSSEFDISMRRTLESIIGGPVSDWSCLKSTLPSSRGGLNLRSASRHTPAAFLSSYTASLPLVEWILGQHPGPSPHTTAAVSALANAAAMPEWLSLEDIDVPVRQRHLSLAIDEVSHHLLQSSAPTIRSRALALSTSLPHAGDWLNVVPSGIPPPWAFAFRTENFGAHCATGWESPSTTAPTLAPNAEERPTSSGTTRLVVGAMVTVSLVTTTSGMWSSQRLSQLPLHPLKRRLAW